MTYIKAVCILLVLGLAAYAQSPLVVDSGSHVVLMQYEPWFAPEAMSFGALTAPRHPQPLLQSAAQAAWGLSGYHSADPAVVRQHVAWLERMGVDGVLLDLTNGLPCTFFERWRDFCSAWPQYPGFQAIRSNVANLYPAWTGIGTKLKVVPLVGAFDETYYATDTDGKTAVEKALDYFVDLIARYPNLSVIYEGRPLVVAYIGCPTLAQTATWRRFLALVQAKGYNDKLTIRLMSGFIDRQPTYWDLPTARAGLHQVSESNPFWSWVDRLNPAFGYWPSYRLRNGQPENMTASVATPSVTGGTRWVDDNGNYYPDVAFRRGGQTFREFMKLARELQPTFLFVHQFNEFFENGPDAETNSDIEPTDWWGTSMVDVVASEIAQYRAALAPAARPFSPGSQDVQLMLTRDGQPIPIWYRPATQYWSLPLTGGVREIQWGLPNDIPTIAYWQGKSRIAVFRPSGGHYPPGLYINMDDLSYHGVQIYVK